MSATWTSRERDYALESNQAPRQRVTDHPLIRKKAQVEAPKKTIKGLKVEAVDMDDPLGSDPLADMDPLSAALNNTASLDDVVAPARGEDRGESSANDWNTRVDKILKEYSTSQHMKIGATFINKSDEANRRVPVNTVKYRLEQLDDSEDGQQQHLQNMGQEECIRYLEQLNRDVANAWNGEERVKSLKLMIQTAKLLADDNIPRVFYPSMFVLVTKILDNFGELVYERIRARALQEKPTLAGEDLSYRGRFKASDIPADAQETCRNWFYKVAGTRDLLPRIYVELSIVKSQRFISDEGLHETLSRVSQSIRGLGDPLSAAYARCYLARRVLDSSPGFLTPLWGSLTDMQMSLFRQVGTARHEAWRNRENLTVQQFMHLLKPAVSFYLDAIGPKASREDFRRVLKTYAEQCNKSSFFLEHILRAFKAEHVTSNLKPVMEFVRNADLSDTDGIHCVFRALGAALAAHPPPQDKALPILNEVWKVVTKIEDPTMYMEVAEVFIEFILKCFSQREADIFLQDVIGHVTFERAFEKLQAPLRRIAELVLVTYTDFTQIVAMSNFMPLLDLFVGSARNEIAKSVLAAFVTMPGSTSDPVVISTITSLAAVLHNSIDSLSFEDEQRRIAELINKFISKVDYGTDLEQHLTFLVDCRAAYPKLEPVKYNLVMGALNLANRTFQYTQGRHTKKTHAFVKACIAFTHITVPSLNDELLRMRLFIFAGQVALQHQLLAQADTLFKATIMQIKEIEPIRRVDNRQVSTAPALADLIVKFASVLVIVPGHPDPKNGPFHLLNGLLRTLQEYEWNEPDQAYCMCRSYLAILPLLAALRQTVLPYHVDRVESNDSLYALSETYVEELHQLVNSVLENLLGELHKLKEDKNPSGQRKVPEVALQLFNVLIAHATLDPSMCTLAARLYAMASKHPNVEKKFLERSLDGLREHCDANKPDSLIPAMIQKLEGK
eukprot:TRINITY_DN2088_c0_g1_i4.p1 TRINITY_DN2088_c0_g1~~TRINITY_DN2088_c0_g1_i4.p1  ORF type:complete len:956 (+),score=238.49 TRINITY_DN2088_c0_g1_i4:68-2935(+)